MKSQSAWDVQSYNWHVKVLDFAPFRGSYVSRLFTVLYFSVRSSRSRALRYGLPILHECQNYLGGRGGLGGSNNITAAHVQEAWQEFHAFYHSLIKKLRWWWKTCQTHLASITRVYRYLLSKQWFYNVSGPFLEIKSANMQKKTFCWSKIPKILRVFAQDVPYGMKAYV